MRTLIIAPQWIGDAVMTQPLLAALAAQGQRLTVAALPWVAPVYRAMPQVAQVLDLPFAHGGLQWKARRQIAAQIRGQFDHAYVLPNSFKSALLPWLAGIPTRIGYVGEMRLGLLTHRLPNPSKHHRPPMVAHYSALAGVATNAATLRQNAPPLAPLDDTAAAHQPRLAIHDDAINTACKAHGLRRGGYYIFAPSAEFGPAKRWPPTHFAQLANLLALADTPQPNNALPHAGSSPVTFVLLGSGKERDLCEDIVQKAQTEARNAIQSEAHTSLVTDALPAITLLNLAGQTTLDVALALVAGAKAVVSNDSGLMHVAAAFQIPQVAVFGSSSPHHTPPLSNKAQVIWLKDDPSYNPPLDCAPCFERSCRFGHTRCLQDISPDRVLAALQKL